MMFRQAIKKQKLRTPHKFHCVKGRNTVNTFKIKAEAFNNSELENVLLMNQNQKWQMKIRALQVA